MERFKKYIKCFSGGVLCGAGCFVMPNVLTAEGAGICIIKFAAEIAVIFLGCILALPKEKNSIDAETFALFSAGMLAAVYVCK